ncbi:putative ribonuclease H-like domain-containing protein [Tanacetum coccineum]|uniref:Ribonuclease H-like domain-containing protein n=1 Tax=Tanacetum coccineum TaxID=301880 RepID=A0ABQ4WXN6_9ASTR
MAKQVELNKQKGKGTGQAENRPVWNNVQILNHQNNFVPKAVLTKSGIFPVNTARQNLSSQAAATSTARKVNTVKPIVNEIRPRNNFYKSHSPIRRLSNRTTTLKANFANHKVNTAGDKIVSVVGGNRETVVKASADFEAFTKSSQKVLEKGYDRFQQLLSQLEAHGAEVSTEDANIRSIGTSSEHSVDLESEISRVPQEVRPFANSTAQMANSNAVMGSWGSAVKTSASYNWRNSRPNFNYNSGPTFIRTEHPLKNMVDRGIFDSGCSGHMTGNKDQLEDFEEFNGGSVTFGGSKGYISGKGRIRVGNLDFDSVSFVKELGHFNLFSISQICDKQHKVLFTETECLVVSSDFKMPDENQILLKVPRHHNMYSFDMKTPSPAKGFACLIAKATSDESRLWHRRLGHINFKNLNKLVKGNLVRGLPSKVFKNDHTCVACHKGKQHRASCKAKLERLISVPLHTLHMDLFGPTSVKSINHASYCLVITDDCTRFSWVFFLASKDETSGILQTFIRQIENQLSHRVKIIRSDNGTEFKNRDMLEFCGNKGIKQEYSTARTPQQNGVAERMNRTLIEAARTMLADSLLPTTFWAEAVSTACYIFNRVRVTKPQNKTPYELLFGHKPIISYIRPFGCHVTILDTLSVLGKFDGKSDEGFLVGYSLNSKAYRVYNLVTKRVEVNLHVNFLEEKPNVKGVGYRWMFDIDYLTDSMKG